MTVVTHKIQIGDRRSGIRAKLVQKDDTGEYVAVDLSSVSGVYFRLEDDQGNSVLGPGTGTDNDCTIVSPATAGKVSYTFPDDAVDEVGIFYGYFEVYDGDKRDTFPNAEKGLRIVIE